MPDLKPYFDAVVAADAEVQRIANAIDEKFREGTEESSKEALALRPALDDAQNKHAEVMALYESMQKASRPNDVAKNFLPVSETEADPDGNKQPTVIKREAYERMPLEDRAKFIRSGGTLED
jgi:hypothetical protein